MLITSTCAYRAASCSGVSVATVRSVFTLPPPPVAMNYTIEFGYESALAGLCINVGMIFSFAFMWSIYALQDTGVL